MGQSKLGNEGEMLGCSCLWGDQSLFMIPIDEPYPFGKEVYDLFHCIEILDIILNLWWLGAMVEMIYAIWKKN